MLAWFLMAPSVIPILHPGDRLPGLKGDFPSGRPAVLPDAASGRVALLALGFTYDSRFAVEAWAARFRKDFGDKPQVACYEIPMIGGMARLGKWFIDSGMRKGTPQKDHENVIRVYGGTEAWKQRLQFQSPDAAYLVLLDQRGRVRWLRHGKFDEQDFIDLSRRVAELIELNWVSSSKSSRRDGGRL